MKCPFVLQLECLFVMCCDIHKMHVCWCIEGLPLHVEARNLQNFVAI